MRRAVLFRSHFNLRPVLAGIGSALIVIALPPSASPGRAETMSSALARAYAGNPDLNQQRAGVRATDENLPRASAAWRPTASATGQFGYNYFDVSRIGAPSTGQNGQILQRSAANPGTLGLTVTQNLFNANRTLNGVRQAEFEYFRRARDLAQHRAKCSAKRRDCVYERPARYRHPRSSQKQHHRPRGAIAADPRSFHHRRDDPNRRRPGRIESCFGAFGLLHGASDSANQHRRLPPGDRRRADETSNRRGRSRVFCRASSAARSNLRSPSIQEFRRRYMR